MKKGLNWIKNINIAHRGLHDISNGVPENSIDAFKLAKENKLAIELDVHILKDGNIVVFHDNGLERCCRQDIQIKKLTYEELSKFNLFDTEYKIPLLKEVLDLIAGTVPVIIEVKTDATTTAICPKLVKILKEYKGLYAVKSFNPLICLWFRIFFKSAVRGVLLSSFENDEDTNIGSIKRYVTKKGLFNFIVKPDFLSVDKKILNTSRIKEARANGMCILGWTFRSKAEKSKYKKYCDSYIFEGFKI